MRGPGVGLAQGAHRFLRAEFGEVLVHSPGDAASPSMKTLCSPAPSEGLVVAEPHRGYRVFSMIQEELVDFCELRFALESQALRYAVQRQPLKLAKQLQQILTEMEANFSPENREKYFELDTNFHKSFFRCAESRFLLQHYENINAIIETVRHYISGTNQATGNAYEDHCYGLLHEGSFLLERLMEHS